MSVLKKQIFALRGGRRQAVFLARLFFFVVRGVQSAVCCAPCLHFSPISVGLTHQKSARNRGFERYGEMRGRGPTLSADPSLRIKWRRLASQLEVERAVARSVAGYATQRLARADLLPAMHADARQITVDAYIRTVANDDVIQSVHIENGRYLAAIYGPRLRSRTSGEVDALVVELHAAQAGHVVSAVVRRDGVGARNRDGQPPAVGCKSVAQCVVGC